MTHIRCYHSGPEWIWERWQWRGTPHSPKLQDYWNLTIRLFSVISRALVGGGFYPSTEVQSVYSTAPADWASCSKGKLFLKSKNPCYHFICCGKACDEPVFFVFVLSSVFLFLLANQAFFFSGYLWFLKQISSLTDVRKSWVVVSEVILSIPLMSQFKYIYNIFCCDIYVHFLFIFLISALIYSDYLVFLFYSMISFGFIYYSQMISVLQSWGLHLLSLLLFLDKFLGVILKYFEVSKDFYLFFISSDTLGLWLNFLLQFFFYYRDLTNSCYLIFSFNFSTFLSFHFDSLTHFIKYGCHSSEFLKFKKILSFHLCCLEIFYLCAIVSKLIPEAVVYVIKSKSRIFSLKFRSIVSQFYLHWVVFVIFLFFRSILSFISVLATLLSSLIIFLLISSMLILFFV